MQSLRNKWILIDKGEHYLIGQIIDVLNCEYLFVRMRPVNKETPVISNVFHISELSCDCRNCINSVFFNTEKELDTWIKFVERGNVSNVVSIDKNKN